jgi:ribose transport system ATP-binding protein
MAGTNQQNDLLKISSLSKSFGPTVALKNVDLEIHGGEIHALIGENGAGKSTLMKILCGALLPDSGSIIFNGAPYTPLDTHSARAAGICMIYQEPALAEHLSVAENIMLGIEAVKAGFIDRKKRDSITARALGELGHPEIDIHGPLGKLSAGLRRIVEIARAVVLGSKLIVLDEPTTSLSKEDCKKLFSLVKKLKQNGKSIIFISHNLEEIFEISDNYTVLRDGEVTAKGIIKETNPQILIKHMAGRELTQFYVRSERKISDTLMEIDALKIRRDSEGNNLIVKRGEILGIAGLLGSGRSSFIRAMFGLRKIISGEIKFRCFQGYALPEERWKEGMGYLSEDRAGEGLALKMTIADNIYLVNKSGQKLFSLISRDKEKSATEEWINRLSVKANSASQEVWQLSGGNQQKVALARLLNENADLILLDEPTRGIDIRSKTEIYKLMDNFVSAASGSPGAIIIISSYLPELLGICDRIAVMQAGKLSAALPADKLSEHSILEMSFNMTESA